MFISCFTLPITIVSGWYWAMQRVCNAFVAWLISAELPFCLQWQCCYTVSVEIIIFKVLLKKIMYPTGNVCQNVFKDVPMQSHRSINAISTWYNVDDDLDTVILLSKFYFLKFIVYSLVTKIIQSGEILEFFIYFRHNTRPLNWKITKYAIVDELSCNRPHFCVFYRITNIVRPQKYVGHVSKHLWKYLGCEKIWKYLNKKTQMN